MFCVSIPKIYVFVKTVEDYSVLYNLLFQGMKYLTHKTCLTSKTQKFNNKKI